MATAKKAAKKVSKKSATPKPKTKATSTNIPTGKKRSLEEVTKNIKIEKERESIKFAKGMAKPERIPGFKGDTELDEIERKVGLLSFSLAKNEGRMSTGLLMLDVVLGGGVTAGMYTSAGKEQCCKTTIVLEILVSAIMQKVPNLAHWDYEGSTGNSGDYVENILRKHGITAPVNAIIGGVKDRDGKWITVPRVRYQPETLAENFFDWLAELERRLPDKVFQAGKWWYVYNDDKAWRKRLGKDINLVDAKMSKGSGKLFIEAPDGGLQAVVLVDSYPSMMPRDVDEESGKGEGLAVQARMFSKQLQRVKGRMMGKRIAWFGINQMRDVPMAMFGPKEKEPGGNALQLYSDCRLRLTSRSISGAKHLGAVQSALKEDNYMEREPSVTVEGGSDIYRYIHCKAIKNKLSNPGVEAWFRVWVEDGNGDANGIDPVFDVYQYLLMTGQLVGNRKKMTLKFKDNEAKKPIAWRHFKTLILGDKEQMLRIYKAIGMRPMLLRDKCFKQIAKEDGLDMFFRYRAEKNQGKVAKDKSELDDDDENVKDSDEE